MSNFINVEVKFFLMSVAWGAILLIIYDCLRIFRKVIHHGTILISIEDILYWVVSSILIFRMMYQLNDGVIRGFSLIGILLGMLIYKYSISELVVKGISFVLIQIKRLIQKVIHILTRPMKFLINQEKRLLVFLVKRVKKRIGNMSYFMQNQRTKLWKALQSKGKRGRMRETDHEKNNKKPMMKSAKQNRNEKIKEQKKTKKHMDDKATA